MQSNLLQVIREVFSLLPQLQVSECTKSCVIILFFLSPHPTQQLLVVLVEEEDLSEKDNGGKHQT